MQRLLFDTPPISEATGERAAVLDPSPETLELLLQAETRLDLPRHRAHLAELCSSVLEARSESLSLLLDAEVLLRPLRELRDITSDVELNTAQDYGARISSFVFHDFQRLCENFQVLQLRPVLRTSTAQEDFQWFISNPPDLAERRGRYVAVLDKQLVADGSTMGEVIEQVSKQKFRRRPVIAYVPEESAKVFGH